MFTVGLAFIEEIRFYSVRSASKQLKEHRARIIGRKVEKMHAKACRFRG